MPVGIVGGLVPAMTIAFGTIAAFDDLPEERFGRRHGRSARIRGLAAGCFRPPVIRVVLDDSKFRLWRNRSRDRLILAVAHPHPSGGSVCSGLLLGIS